MAMLNGTERTGGWSSVAARCLIALLSLLVTLSLDPPVFAQQNPCDEIGADCRLMTAAEVKALKDRVLALRAALPVPDPARWVLPAGVDEAYTMPYIAESNLGAAMTCNSWPAGCFTENNSVSFIYDAVLKGGEPAKKPDGGEESKDLEKTLKDLAASVQGMQAEMANRIEIDAKLLPYAHLVDNVDGKCVDVTETEAVNIEKSAEFLTWESGDGTRLTMVFGPRTCKEEETLRVEKPAKNLAPVKSIMLEITGPNKAEVTALKKKINRKAFEALLGAVLQ
jgi:hypothetical protein